MPLGPAQSPKGQGGCVTNVDSLKDKCKVSAMCGTEHAGHYGSPRARTGRSPGVACKWQQPLYHPDQASTDPTACDFIIK